MKLTKSKLREIIREVMTEGPFQHQKYDFYNKNVERVWGRSDMAKKKRWLKKAMPTASRKFLDYDYEDLTPEIRKRLYYMM